MWQGVAPQKKKKPQTKQTQNPTKEQKQTKNNQKTVLEETKKQE